MKLRKTLAAVVAAAMAVTMAVIPASAVSEEMGIKDQTATGLVPDQYNSVALPVELLKEKVDFALTDVITVSVSAVDESVDDSTWSVCAMAQGDESTNWASNWAGTYGGTELTATVEEILKTDGVELDTLFKVFFKVVNLAEGTESVDVNYSISIAPATPDDDTAGDDNAADDDTVGDSEEAPGDSTEVPEKEPGPAAKLELANGGRTVIDSGLVRTNIFNEWTGDEADMIVAKDAFAGANLISIKFTVTGVTEAFDAWIDFADSAWAVQYWGEGNEGNAGVTQTPVRIEADGTYVLTAKLDSVIDAIAYMSVKTNLEAEGEEAPITITIDEIMINEEIEAPAPGESTDPDTNPDTGVTLVVVPAVLAAAALATSGIVLKKRSK